jgi:DNA sulfur modification protein DndD
MIIERIEIENFGPYFHKQAVDLGSGQQPVIVIHGENMSGKTSFLNAVRWALYGYAKDRSGKRMQVRKLINDDAFREGQRRVSVKLHIRSRSGEAIVLRRQMQAKMGVPEAVLDTDFDEVMSIEVDGDVRPQSRFDDIVNSLMPEDISRFFLFDGELLNEYEDLVRDESEVSARKVKQSIEMILGVPAARQGRDDVRALREGVDRRYRSEAKKDSTAADAAEQSEVLVSTRDGLVRDRDALAVQLEAAETELRGLEGELKQYDALRDDAVRLEGLRTSIEECGQRRADLLAQRRSHVADLWRDALAPRLHHEIERLELELSEIDRALTDLRYAEHRLADLQEAAAVKTCKTCGQAMPEESMAKIRADMAETARRVETLTANASPERYQELHGTIKHLRDIAPAGVEKTVAQIEREMGQLTLDRHRHEKNASLLVERLKDVDEGLIAEYVRKRTKLLRHIAQINVETSALEQQISDADSAIADLKRRLKEQDLPALRQLKAELEIYEALEALFGAAIEELIEELRAEVEREASAIFQTLTTDQSYSGLRINAQYGLTILDRDGRDVLVRSAGAEQVVALSLIGALNRLAIRKGPVIMDTPFGRLDTKHRANILRFVPTLAEQVVLLVHGGEIDRERDLKEIAGRIDEEYMIDHVSSSQSVITRVKEGSHV